jgi:NAD(P)-dependent dehydrogenase (short-subunit alcohol dehydrogenase family)
LSITFRPIIDTVLGANSGVGYATARILASAAEDFHVIMAARSMDKVQKALHELESDIGVPGKLSALQMDVTDEESIEKAVEEVQRRHGRLDVLINNAGATSASDNIRERFILCFHTNVLGPALVSAAFRALLLKSSNPYSIFVGSGVGSLATAAGPSSLALKFPNGEMYRASKAALNMVMLDEWTKFKDQGLKTFCVDPGLVVSNLRGTSDAARTANGMAKDPLDAGRNILAILQGKRDAETGKCLSIDAVHPW